MPAMTSRESAITIFKSAVAAVQPEHLIPAQLRLNGNILHIIDQQVSMVASQKIYVIGGGKASAAMALAVEQLLGDRITAGIVITKYGHSLPLETIICLEAGHPVPDEAGLAATKEMLSLLEQARKDDIVICLISGGASSLWIDLPNAISLEDMQAVFQLLLKCGASIDEMNCVRKHLSAIKGGQLLRFAPSSKWFSLVISDVPGDDLSVIASGPTVPDTGMFTDVEAILNRYSLTEKLPASVKVHIQRGLDGLIEETPKCEDPVFQQVYQKIIGSNIIALEAAAIQARAIGFEHIYISNDLCGDAAVIGEDIVGVLEKYSGGVPACFLYGGETTVAVSGHGKGGRNQHLALSAVAVMHKNNITLLAAGTDGTDGPTDAAGAIADSQVISTMHDRRLDPGKYLENHDAYHFFENVGALLKTGATQTNVMDLVIGIVN